MFPKSVKDSLYVEFLDAGVTDLDLAVPPTEFLETDVTFARTRFDGRRGRSIVSFDGLRLFVQVQIVDKLAVEYHAQARTHEPHFNAVPLGGFVDLHFRRESLGLATYLETYVETGNGF